jgi:glutaminase
MNKLLEVVVENNRYWTKQGKLASYIPELTKANADILGVSIVTLDGEEYAAGEYETKFTIQSISKIITLMIALLDNGVEKVFSKVGVEPTADAFNSIINLEAKSHQKPLNPMINAGAIATVSLVCIDNTKVSFKRILEFTRLITGNPSIDINLDVYKSEKETGHKNRSLAYFMKSTGIIEGDVEEVLDVYFKQCSIEATCVDIAKIGAMLANDGVLPWSGERAIPRNIARIVKTIMVTCGLYDASGQFAVEVGIPAKSGVGGGIVAAVPSRMGIGVVGPALDVRGNSIAGIKVLEELSKELDLNIF